MPRSPLTTWCGGAEGANIAPGGVLVGPTLISVAPTGVNINPQGVNVAPKLFVEASTGVSVVPRGVDVTPKRIILGGTPGVREVAGGRSTG